MDKNINNEIENFVSSHNYSNGASFIQSENKESDDTNEEARCNQDERSVNDILNDMIIFIKAIAKTIENISFSKINVNGINEESEVNLSHVMDSLLKTTNSLEDITNSQFSNDKLLTIINELVQKIKV